MADTTQARNEGWSEADGPFTSDAAANPNGWEKHSEAKDSEKVGSLDLNEADEAGENDLLAAIPQEWKDSAAQAWKTGEEMIRANPIRAAAIGLGVGVVLGYLLKGPRHG